MQAQPPSTKRTSQKLIRDMGDAVISVSLSDDGTLAAAGTTAARTVVFSVADNTELTSIQLKSGVNAVVFLGSGPIPKSIVSICCASTRPIRGRARRISSG